MNLVHQIRECIEQKLYEGFNRFIIYPFGEIGMQTKEILKNMYGIDAEYVLDNHLCKFNSDIKPLEFLNTIPCNKFCVILASTNPTIYAEIKNILKQYFIEENIAVLSSILDYESIPQTTIGKYSYGPLCRNHRCIESIGAFSSFAFGTEVVENHPMQYITTHPLISWGGNNNDLIAYNSYKKEKWYFEGVQAHSDKLKPIKRLTIGNDVWLGGNVLITNYSNIGNGVIAGAGSIITKDVPDYAVVAGAPARIIRFRYSPDEIKCLNKIAWWNWTDDAIRDRYDDFYLPIKEFIKKYLELE